MNNIQIHKAHYDGGRRGMGVGRLWEGWRRRRRRRRRGVFSFSRLFFLALFLTLADHEVCKVLLNTEGGESCFTTVHPALLDNLGHTMEYLRGAGQGLGDKGWNVVHRICVYKAMVYIYTGKSGSSFGISLAWEDCVVFPHPGISLAWEDCVVFPHTPPHARLTTVYHLTQN